MALSDNQLLKIEDLCVPISGHTAQGAVNMEGMNIGNIGYHQFLLIDRVEETLGVNGSFTAQNVGICLLDYNYSDVSTIPCQYLYLKQWILPLQNVDNSTLSTGFTINTFRVTSSDGVVIGEISPSITLTVPKNSTRYFYVSGGILHIPNKTWIEEPRIGLQITTPIFSYTLPSKLLRISDLSYKLPTGTRTVSSNNIYYTLNSATTFHNATMLNLTDVNAPTAQTPQCTATMAYCIIKLPFVYSKGELPCRYIYINNFQFYPKAPATNTKSMAVTYYVRDANGSSITNGSTVFTLSANQYRKFTINDGILDVENKKWVKSPNIVLG
jgi:hypothetical protein